MLASACAVGVVAVVAACIHNKRLANRDECVHNLWHLMGSKDEWAVDQDESTNATPTWDDLRPFYVGPAEWPSNQPAPQCPSGGTWTIGRIGEPPTCSVASHTAKLKRQIREQEEMVASGRAKFAPIPGSTPHHGTNLRSDSSLR